MISAMATDDAVSADDLALAGAAVASMHDELKVYPKPGLVSPVDSGAHADMDFDLMCRSADSLLQPFAALAAAGHIPDRVAAELTRAYYRLRALEHRVQMLAGRLDIDSAPGKGTRITARVPFARMH